MRWIWMGFENESAPRGARARGALIVAVDLATQDAVTTKAIAALATARRAIEFSDYTYQWAEIGAEHGPPRPEWVNRPLSTDEARAVAAQWTGGVASPDQLRRAMLEDGDPVGVPLFRKGDR